MPAVPRNRVAYAAYFPAETREALKALHAYSNDATDSMIIELVDYELGLSTRGEVESVLGSERGGFCLDLIGAEVAV